MPTADAAPGPRRIPRGWPLLLALLCASPGSGEELPFWRDGRPVTLEVPIDGSGTLDRRVARRIEWMLLPPAELEVERLLPADAVLDGVVRRPPDVIVKLTLPARFLDRHLDELVLERMSRQLILGLAGEGDLRRLHLVARPSRDRPYRPLSFYLPTAEVPQKEVPSGSRAPRPLVQRAERGAGTPSGALEGKIVYVSAGHGFVDDSPAWRAQRGNTHGLVEDLHVAETVSEYLVPMLELAGATVFTARERDLGGDLAIVDDGDGAPGYSEVGDPEAFTDSGLPGFAQGAAPYSPTTNPFGSTGGSSRRIATAPGETARATWTPTLPRSGFYTVSVSWAEGGPDRASDAHYIVRHSGGESHFRVDQEFHGATWVPLGRFHFEGGFDPSSASVVLANDSAESGATVSADAVRFGGGLGDVVGPDSQEVSGRPRGEEGAESFVQYLGAPTSVYAANGTAGDDVLARSRWTAWENVEGVDDAVFVSWHSNAGGGSARGTSTFVYSANPPDGTLDDTQAVPGSVELATLVHDEIVADVRALWDPAWTDRGVLSAYFGELNPSHNDETPSCLLEVAFHDNAQDAEALADPRFRRLVARAVVQGIVRYFAQRDGLPTRLPPETPRSIAVRPTGPTSAEVSWQSPPSGGPWGDPAGSYRVSTSSNGKGFDEGTVTSATALDLSGLATGEPTYVRVSARNEGGESLPSETLVVIPRESGVPRVLLVAGFDRLDRGLLLPVDESDVFLGTVQRMDLERMNTFDYVIEHAEALRHLELAVGSSANEALAAPDRALDPSIDDAVIWILGRESTADETLSEEEQALLEAYLSDGGSLFLSGSEIAWDLDERGSTGDRIFYNAVLRAAFVADDANVHEARGSAGSILGGISSIPFDDGTGGNYPVPFPDVVAPLEDARLCADYAGGAGGACVQVDTGVYRVVQLAFPFESITLPVVRRNVLTASMAFLVPELGRIFADGFESGSTDAWSS